MTKYKWLMIQIQKGSNSVHTIVLSVFMYLHVFCTHMAYTIHTQPQVLSTQFQEKNGSQKNPTIKVWYYITKGYIIFVDNYTM